MITHVAIKCTKDNSVWALPKPARHHHIIRAMFEAYNPQYKDGDLIIATDGTQGFLIDGYKFVDRVTGKQHALATGQIKEGMGKHKELFSEDLW